MKRKKLTIGNRQFTSVRHSKANALYLDGTPRFRILDNTEIGVIPRRAARKPLYNPLLVMSRDILRRYKLNEDGYLHSRTPMDLQARMEYVVKAKVCSMLLDDKILQCYMELNEKIVANRAKKCELLVKESVAEPSSLAIRMVEIVEWVDQESDIHVEK